MTGRGARPYADPYVAGAALGLVLLTAFVVMGRGLGASGAFNASAAGLVSVVSPATAASNPWFARYLDGAGPWRDWLLYEIAGVMAGGAASAWLAGRMSRIVERGPGQGVASRLLLAWAGGSVMGAGAVVARGCTSGQALTGGALLSVGSWLFMLSMFAAACLAAVPLKRVWR